MKNFINYFFCSVIIASLFQSCRKDSKLCNAPIDFYSIDNQIDINLIKTIPSLYDTLKKYPNLKVDKIINDSFQVGIICNYYHYGYLCFSNSYSLHWSKKDNSLFCNDFRPKVALNNNFNTNINYLEALEIAKKEIDFGDRCLAYQLGFLYADTAKIETTNSYKLVWKITDFGGSAYVNIDARNGKVYSKFDGIFL